MSKKELISKNKENIKTFISSLAKNMNIKKKDVKIEVLTDEGYDNSDFVKTRIPDYEFLTISYERKRLESDIPCYRITVHLLNNNAVIKGEYFFSSKKKFLPICTEATIKTECSLSKFGDTLEKVDYMLDNVINDDW